MRGWIYFIGTVVYVWYGWLDDALTGWGKSLLAFVVPLLVDLKMQMQVYSFKGDHVVHSIWLKSGYEWVPTHYAHVHFLCSWLTNITDKSRGYKKRFLSFIAISIQLEFGHSLYKNNKFTITWETKARAFTVELLRFGKIFFTKGAVKPHDQIYKSWKSETINIYKYLFFVRSAILPNLTVLLVIFFTTVHQAFAS